MKGYADGTPIWTDLQTPDVDGARAFYEGLFGWTSAEGGPDAGGHAMFRKDGKQVAGVGPMQTEDMPPVWTTYFQTTDADRVAARVEQAGGTVLTPPFDVAAAGRMGVFSDPGGAVWAVWEPLRHPGAELFNEPGSMTWNELVTVDVPGARAFYHSVLGLGSVDMPGESGYVCFTADERPIAGMMPIGDDMPPMPGTWSVYFAVDDTDETAKKAVELGGGIQVLPMDTPAGRFAVLTDPQDVSFSVIKNDPSYQM